MARIPYLGPDDVTEEFRDVLAVHSNGPRALAHSPDGLRLMLQFARWARSTAIDPRLRELAILQAGYAAAAPYEWVHHLLTRAEFGVTDDDVRAIAVDTVGGETHLSDLDRLVLRASREITQQGVLSDPTFQALASHLDTRTVVELVVIIGFYNQVARTFGSLGVDVEEGCADLLVEFPLPTA